MTIPSGGMQELTKRTVTLASRVMLPTHAAFSGLLGAAWAFQSPSRTNVPALTYLRGLWPIPYTGIILLTLSGVIVGAMLLRDRRLVALALSAGVFIYLCLALGTAASLNPAVADLFPPVLMIDDHASLSAPLWSLYVASAHLASMVSVVFEETDSSAARIRELEDEVARLRASPA